MARRGIGLGAGLMYILDPASGPQRRAQLRDRGIRVGRRTKDYVGKAGRDLSNRVKGAVSEVRKGRQIEWRHTIGTPAMQLAVGSIATAALLLGATRAFAHRRDNGEGSFDFSGVDEPLWPEAVGQPVATGD